VVFAALIGTLFLRERFGRTRVIAALLVAGGIAAINLA
jgi:drug/metabolite transporter (DMT)-like permease